MIEENGDIIKEEDLQPGDMIFFAQKSDGEYKQSWDGTDKDDIHYKHINHVAILPAIMKKGKQ